MLVIHLLDLLDHRPYSIRLIRVSTLLMNPNREFVGRFKAWTSINGLLLIGQSSTIISQLSSG